MGMRELDIHRSEWDWVGSEFNFTIYNNGTLDELGNEVKKVLQFIR
jgi:hypothetical protein